MPVVQPYRGRIAPSPTGYLHLGHARTFWTAKQRAESHQGTLVLRNENLDFGRCKPEFVAAMLEDLRWFGFHWAEGPDRGGEFGPYAQSERMRFYREAFDRLRAAGFLYRCNCSRRDVLRALSAPHAGDEEPVYPGTCRPKGEQSAEGASNASSAPVSWRFRVRDGETISFLDGCVGAQSFSAGRDFGDFVVWRHDNIPAYQLAVVVDDAAMKISEVVRGADLLISTARQILLYRALGFAAPDFFHCPLLTDDKGVRLAKRHDALGLRTLRERGETPQSLRAKW